MTLHPAVCLHGEVRVAQLLSGVLHEIRHDACTCRLLW